MGLYTITTRADGTVVTGSGSTSDIWDVDHINHVTHTEPASINSHEQSLSQMQLETNPAPLGVVSLPASLAAELERLRFALKTCKRIIAGSAPAHWYTAMASFSSELALAATAARQELHTPGPITPSLVTTLQWDTTAYDTVGTIVTLDGLLVPADGVYILGGTLRFINALAGDYRLTLIRGDDAVASNQYITTVARAKGLTVETVAHCTAGELISLQVYQTSGAFQTPTTAPFPALWMALVGR